MRGHFFRYRRISNEVLTVVAHTAVSIVSTGSHFAPTAQPLVQPVELAGSIVDFVRG